jgi:hypothetical protein
VRGTGAGGYRRRDLGAHGDETVCLIK